MTLPRRQIPASRCLPWLLLTTYILAFTLLLVQAQPNPEIDPTTMSAIAGAPLQFQFRATPAPVDAFQIETASSLDTPISWTLHTSARIEAIAEGIFKVTLNSPTQPTFYRVVAQLIETPTPQLWINEAMADNSSKLPAPDGQFYDWIELFNPNDEAVQLSNFSISDDPALPAKWKFPTTLIQPNGFLLVYASDLNLTNPNQPLHTNFKLKASGEILTLSSPQGVKVDELEIPALAPDQSFGRSPDGSSNLVFFAKANASPGSLNASVSLPAALPSPQFSPEGGLYAQSVLLNIAPADPQHVLHYTLDGSLPSPQSPILNTPLNLTRSTVVRVIATNSQGQKSPPTSHTYLIGISHSLPVVSIATAPTNMEFRNGYLYGMGPNVINSTNKVLQNYPFSGSNAWLDREVEVALEFFEPDGSVGFRQQAGMKIYGGWGSRGYPQKSLALFARRKFGSGKFKHSIFPDQSVDEFESFVLRNSGNDNQSTHQTPLRPPITEFGPNFSYGSYFANGTFTLLRDAFMQQLLDDTTLDTQAYRPAVVYLNGEYWGIYNLREKVTEHHVTSHHHLAEGSVDLIEGFGTVRAGSGTTYNQLRQFLSTKNLAIESNYTFVASTYLDIDNFIDYHLAVIYFQNFDIGNIKCWRPRVPGGKFRWLVYDQDYGFGLWPAAVYVPAMARDYADYANMFKFYTAGTGTSTAWPNGGGVTLMLRSLLANPGFKERFIRRCADLLNSNFREAHVTNTLDRMAAVIRPEMAAHLQRWSWNSLTNRGYGKPHQPEYQPFIPSTWESNLIVVSKFGLTRPTQLRLDCQSHFKLKSGTGNLSADVSPTNSASIQLNSLRLNSLPWSGIYFADIPSTLTALPRPGFQFSHWSTPGAAISNATLQITVTSNTLSSLTAICIPASTDSPSTSDLIISEIQYHPASNADSGDWIELHNRGSQPIDLKGWIFRDQDDLHTFPLPDQTLAPGGYLVLCEDEYQFRIFHPSSTIPTAGSFRFNLGNEGDTLRLYRPNGSEAYRVNYLDEAPWPTDADGSGPSLQLVSPSLDPSSPASWKSSPATGGSPGLP